MKVHLNSATEDEFVVELGDRPALAALFNRIRELSTLPTAAQKIMELVDDAASSGQTVLTAVESDPVLAAKVLRRVNSAFYGMRNEVSDLRSAIGLLGYREIRNLAMTVYVARLFRDGEPHANYSREKLWEHCVGVAHAARLLARETSKTPPDQAYLAGLLHDIGLILIDQYMHASLLAVVDRLSENVDTTQVERQVMPFDHTELGAYLCQSWRFPAAVLVGVRFHHAPLACQGKLANMAAIISIANWMCSRAGYTSLGVANVRQPDEAVFRQVELEPSRLDGIWERLEHTLEITALVETV